MFSAAAIALLVTLALALVRAILGRNSFRSGSGSQHHRHGGHVAAGGLWVLTGRPEFLDLAIVYGLLNVIGTIAVLKYFQRGDLGDPGMKKKRLPRK